MRKQLRPPKPECLIKKGDEWNQKWADRKTENTSAVFAWHQFEGESVRSKILLVLDKMNQGHCSFCDSFPLWASSKLPIEHRQPKSRPEFYEKAYEWENLYYCCEFCQSEKGDQWDERLLRPDAEDYEFSVYFEFDFETGEIRPNRVANETIQDQAKTTIKLYGLDDDARRRCRKLELRKWRKASGDIDDYAFRDYLDA